MWMNKLFGSKLLAEETGGEGSSGGIVTGNATSFVPDLPGSSSDSADDSTESSVNWADLDAEMDADESAVEGAEVVEGEGSGAEPPAAQSPQTPEKPAEVPPAAQTPPAAAPEAPKPTEVAPVAPQASTEQPQQAAPSAEDYATWRTKKAQELESGYAISEDDAAALLTEPEKVLPRLMANAHLQVLESAMRATQAMLPVMLQEIQQHTEVNTRAKNLFTSINPDLADSQYEPAIMEFGRTFRNVNKTASPEEAARAIGALVRSALGIAQVQAPATHAAVPMAPATPVPFTPARGGGAAPRAISSNPFEQLAEEFLKDE